jgi:hypothetical protein
MKGQALHALTTGELARFRKELEHAVKRLGQAPVVEDLQAKLRLVLDEQESRTRIRQANGR